MAPGPEVLTTCPSQQVHRPGPRESEINEAEGEMLVGDPWEVSGFKGGRAPSRGLGGNCVGVDK